MSGVYLYCPRCRLRIGATLGQMETLEGPTCPTCAAMDGMGVPMYLVSRPPDNNRLRTGVGAQGAPGLAESGVDPPAA